MERALWIFIPVACATIDNSFRSDLDKTKDGEAVWATMPTSILPNLLGFSMGGMAIMLAFSGSKVFTYITQDGKQHSYFIKIVASFYHFIIIQTLASMFGILCQTYSHWLLSFFGFWSMIYALLVAPATAAQLHSCSTLPE